MFQLPTALSVFVLRRGVGVNWNNFSVPSSTLQYGSEQRCVFETASSVRTCRGREVEDIQATGMWQAPAPQITHRSRGQKNGQHDYGTEISTTRDDIHMCHTHSSEDLLAPCGEPRVLHAHRQLSWYNILHVIVYMLASSSRLTQRAGISNLQCPHYNHEKMSLLPTNSPGIGYE